MGIYMPKYLAITVLIILASISLYGQEIYAVAKYNIVVYNPHQLIGSPPKPISDYNSEFVNQTSKASFCIDFPENCRAYLKRLISLTANPTSANCMEIYRPKFSPYSKICGPNGAILFIVSPELDCSKPTVLFLHGRDSEPISLLRKIDMDYHNGILNSFEKTGVQYIAPLVNAHTSYFDMALFKGSAAIDIENSIYLSHQICPEFADLTIAGMSYGAHLSEVIYLAFYNELKFKRLISIGGMLRRKPRSDSLLEVNDVPTPRELIAAGIYDAVFACGNVLFVNGDYDKYPAEVKENVENLKLIREKNCPSSRLEFEIFSGYHEVPIDLILTHLGAR